VNFLYFLYLIFLFLPGETIIQLCFPKKKEKILKFSIIEHLVYLIILGLCFSSLISLILSLFQNLNIYSLLLINIFVFLLSLFLDIFNKKLFNNYLLIFRIIDELKSGKDFLKKFKKDYLISTILSFVFIIFFITILSQYTYIPNQDTWRYIEWAIDITKFQPDFFENQARPVWYLGSAHQTSFYNFFLISMIVGDVESWELIIKFIIPTLMIILFILLIFDFANKINKKINYLPIILLSSTYFLLNWFFYSLPTTIAILLGILSIRTFFIKESRSYLIFGISIVFIYLFHTATALLFLMGIACNLIILFLIKFSYKGLRIRLIEKIKEKFFIYLFIFILFFIIIIGGVIIIFTPILFLPTYFERFLDLYSKLQSSLVDYELRSFPPPLNNWFRFLMGPHVVLLSLILLVFIVREFKKNGKNFLNSIESEQSLNRNVKNHYNLLNALPFYWVLEVLLILICIFLPIWYWFSTIPYLWYRYFIYIDLACLFLAPFGFNAIIKYLGQLEYKKKINLNKYKKFFEFSFIGVTLIFSSYHIINWYNLNTHYEYIPEANLNIYYWLRDNTNPDSLYVASPYSDCGQIYYHPIMNDRKFLDPTAQWYYFDDSQFKATGDRGYQQFLSYLYSSKKLLNLRFAYINNSDNTAIYTYNKVDYIILDSYHNPILIKFMSIDNNSFLMLQNWTYWRPFTKEPYNIYLFYLKDNITIS